jgi:hypothetical protein
LYPLSRQNNPAYGQRAHTGAELSDVPSMISDSRSQERGEAKWLMCPQMTHTLVGGQFNEALMSRQINLYIYKKKL